MGVPTNDFEAIRRVIALYGQLLDSKRFDDWSQLFAQDAVFRVWGRSYSGRAEILREIGEMQPDSPGKHVVLQPVIDLDSEDRARSWTDLCALATTPSPEAEYSDFSIQIVTIGRYHDRFERSTSDGRWRIQQRVLVMAGEDVPEDIDPTPAY